MRCISPKNGTCHSIVNINLHEIHKKHFCASSNDLRDINIWSCWPWKFRSGSRGKKTDLCHSIAIGYLPTNDAVTKFIPNDLDLLLRDNKFEISISWKQREQAQTCEMKLSTWRLKQYFSLKKWKWSNYCCRSPPLARRAHRPSSCSWSFSKV